MQKKGLQEEDLTDEEYLEEVERIVKCNEEVDTEEVIPVKIETAPCAREWKWMNG